MAGTADVTIGKRGGGDPRIVQCSGIRASWELNVAGQFSGLIPASELLAAGYNAGTDLRGYWLDWRHPTAGRWGGVVSTTRSTPDGLEIGGEQFHVLLRKRLIRLVGNKAKPYEGTPGKLFKDVLAKAADSGALYLAPGTIDTGGEPMDVEWQQADAYDEAIPEIVDDSGNYWKVTADRVVSFSRLPGRDLTATRRLVYGRHVALYEYVLDLWSAENYLIGRGKETTTQKDKKTGKKKKKTTRYEVTAQDAASVALFGPLMGVRSYGGSRSRESVRRKLAAVLAVTATPRALVTLTLVDDDGCFAWFEEGDAVTVELPSASGTQTLRILSRAVSDEGAMLVAGEII